MPALKWAFMNAKFMLNELYLKIKPGTSPIYLLKSRSREWRNLLYAALLITFWAFIPHYRFSILNLQPASWYVDSQWGLMYHIHTSTSSITEKLYNVTIVIWNVDIRNSPCISFQAAFFSLTFVHEVKQYVTMWIFPNRTRNS